MQYMSIKTVFPNLDIVSFILKLRNEEVKCKNLLVPYEMFF